MISLEFHDDVRHEIESAVDWYENQSPGLGFDYLSEMEESFSILLSNPNAWANLELGFKKFILHRFPFSIIYRIQNDVVFVLAVAHAGRKPGYWRSRLRADWRVFVAEAPCSETDEASTSAGTAGSLNLRRCFASGARSGGGGRPGHRD